MKTKVNAPKVSNSAKEIEKLVLSIVRAEIAKVPVYTLPLPELIPLPGQVERLIEIKEKIQPSHQEGGGGVKSPLTEDGMKREYHPMRTFTDSSRLILYSVKPIKKMTFKTGDATPKDVVFIFAEPKN